MLFLRVVQQQAQLHALAGQLAIGQAAQPGQDNRKATLRAGFHHRLAGLAVSRPVGGHLRQIVHQQIGSGGQILRAPVAIAVGAGRPLGIVGPGPIAGARAGAVQILAPEQELDGVVAGGDIRLDTADLLQLLGQQLLGDGGGVDLLAAMGDLRIGDHIGGVERILVGIGAVRGIDIIDQPLVERPGIHLAFPVIDNGIAETIDLGLLVGHTRGQPGPLGGLHRGGAGRIGQRLHGGLQILRLGKRVGIHRLGDIGVIRQYGAHRAFARRCRCRRRNSQQPCRRQSQNVPSHTLAPS